MTVTALRDTEDAYTSALGYMGADPAFFATEPIIAILPRSATANTTPIAATEYVTHWFESTAAGPKGQFKHVPAETTAEAVMEIRRRSGLTWEEISELFDVSRRSIHHWANGKPVTAGHDRMIRKTLAALRRLDQEGDQAKTRASLLKVDQSIGTSWFDLLKEGRFDEVWVCTGRFQALPEPRRVPLSKVAREARRPQPPMLLLEAEQSRPDFPPAKARVVRAKRTPKTAS